MRATLGIHIGPLYIGTGNLLKTKQRRGSRPGLVGWVVAAPFIVIWVGLVALWWTMLGLWRGGAWLIHRALEQRPAPTREPEDDPAWKPTR